VLRDAGVSHKRDACDERIINEVKTGTGRIPDSQQEVGGWPRLKSAPAPAHADKDGMAMTGKQKMDLIPVILRTGTRTGTRAGIQMHLPIFEEFINSLVTAP